MRLVGAGLSRSAQALGVDCQLSNANPNALTYASFQIVHPAGFMQWFFLQASTTLCGQ
jgi:hypothetical protein